jgi:hypothetical protein
MDKAVNIVCEFGLNPSSPKPECRRKSLGLAKFEYKNPLSPPPFLFFTTPHWLATTVKGCASDIIPLDSNTRQQPSATSTSTACWTHQQPSTINPLDTNNTNNIDNSFGRQTLLDDNPLWNDNSLWTTTTSTSINKLSNINNINKLTAKISAT